MPAIEITEQHIQLVQRAAASAKRRWPFADYDDLFDDGLQGLVFAWQHWENRGPFEHFAAACIKMSIRRWRQHAARLDARLPTVSIDLPLSDFAPDFDDTPALELAEPTVLESLVMHGIQLEAVFQALQDEPPVVREAVLGESSTRELARKYGYRSASSIRQFRDRFISNFLRSWDTGTAYARPAPPGQLRKGPSKKGSPLS